MNVFFDISSKYFDKFDARFGLGVYCNTLEEFLSLEDPIHTLSVGLGADALVAHLVGNKKDIKLIYVHLRRLEKNNEYYQRLVSAGYRVKSVQLGVNYLREKASCGC